MQRPRMKSTLAVATLALGLTTTLALARPVVAVDVGAPIGVGVGIGPEYGYAAPDYYDYLEVAYYGPAWGYDYPPVVTTYAPAYTAYPRPYYRTYSPQFSVYGEVPTYAYRSYPRPYYRNYATPGVSVYGGARGGGVYPRNPVYAEGATRVYGRDSYSRYPRYASAESVYIRDRGYARNDASRVRERQSVNEQNARRTSLSRPGVSNRSDLRERTSRQAASSPRDKRQPANRQVQRRTHSAQASSVQAGDMRRSSRNAQGGY
jgi:hypothetical protein